MTRTWNPRLADIDLSDLDFWARPTHERHAAFAVLRAQPEPVFFPEPDTSELGLPPGPGYHALVRHADVVEASRRPELFSSAHGGATNIADLPDEFAEFFGSMINMDAPRHARLRRIVSRAFAPKMVAAMGEDVRRAAARIVDGVCERGECDFATEVAARLPLQIICDMMGIPPAHHDFVLERTNRILGGLDPEFLPEGGPNPVHLLTAGAELAELVRDLSGHRRQHPRGDLISALVTANVDGESLTEQEIASFFVLLVVAGNETTRNAITHGLVLLDENPDQRALWASDFERHAATAVEEILRLSSPLIYMRRTVTGEVTLGGHRFRTGDKVLLFYWSANRDEAVFADPGRFDVTRDPNPHVVFGGPGPHFCLGAHLARWEITAMFRELFARLPDIAPAGPAVPLSGGFFVNGIKHLPCRFTPRGRA